MNNAMIDGITNIDEDLIEKYFKLKEKYYSKKQKKKTKQFLKWGSFAACVVLVLCFIPIVNLIFDGSHSDAPINVEYNNIDDVHKQLGSDTLLVGLDYDVATTKSILVSYNDDGEGNAVFSEPQQLLLRQTYDFGNGVVNADLYILFDKEDVSESYIGGYEEQGLSKEINGVKVHYSNIFDGSNHAQAKFIYEGNLYVIDAISSGEIDLDYFLEKLLK